MRSGMSENVNIFLCSIDLASVINFLKADALAVNLTAHAYRYTDNKSVFVH